MRWRLDDRITILSFTGNAEDEEPARGGRTHARCDRRACRACMCCLEDRNVRGAYEGSELGRGEADQEIKNKQR